MCKKHSDIDYINGFPTFIMILKRLDECADINDCQRCNHVVQCRQCWDKLCTSIEDRDLNVSQFLEAFNNIPPIAITVKRKSILILV
jgi:hypothetical protein